MPLSRLPEQPPEGRMKVFRANPFDLYNRPSHLASRF
jgi:hypothetical protein